MCTLSGIIRSSLKAWLNFSLEVLVRVCRRKMHEDVLVEWSSKERIKTSGDLLVNNSPAGKLLSGVFSVMDGGRVLCAEYIDEGL